MSESAVSPETSTRPERRVAINSGLLLLAFGFQALVSLVLVGIVARYLGQAGLGRYGFVISFIELIVVFSDLGMNRILTREIAKDQTQASRYASAIWTLRLFLSLVILVIVGLVATSSGDPQLWLAIMVYYVAQVLFLLGDVYNAVFHGFQRMEFQFWAVTGSQVLLLAFTVAAVQLELGLVAILAARLAANALRLLFVWWMSRRRFATGHVVWAVIPGLLVTLRSLPAAWATLRQVGRSQARAFIDAQGQRLVARWDDVRLTGHLLLESLPVGISLILRNYIWRVGVVLTVLWLGQQQGDLVNGLLYGPLRVVQQLRIIPAAFSASMLPVLSNRARGRMDEFDTAFAKSIKLFLAISLLITLAFNFLAEPFVVLLLGTGIDLAGAAEVLAVLGWVIVIYFPNWLYGVALVALGRQRLETLGLALGLLAGLPVARWAIPRYEALGVAYAILVAEGVFFLVGTAALWRHFHWRRTGPAFLKIVVACGAAGLVFMLGHQAWTAYGDSLGLGETMAAVLELALVGGLGLLALLLALWLLRTFDQDEIEGIRAMLRLQRGKS